MTIIATFMNCCKQLFLHCLKQCKNYTRVGKKLRKPFGLSKINLCTFAQNPPEML